ncbi:MAG: site-2 protease family protein [Clostridia bacterium]|nr:site-2 protease family protein [Clostridia bacterium]
MSFLVDLINNVFYILPAVLIAICLHEFAHGLVSYSLGDPTPKAQGRLSLNPFHHLDLWGTLMLLFLGFGWAKPVEVDARYYENPKSDMVKVALAGPIMNFFVAFICLLIMGVMGKNVTATSWTIYLYNLLYYTALINVGLGLFNLIPLPPLDGSKVLGALLPADRYFAYMRFEQYGMILVLILVMSGAFSGFLVSARSAVIGGMENMVDSILRIF